MQDYYTCEVGQEEEAYNVAHTKCKKLVKDKHYETQIQCIMNCSAIHLHKRIKKDAREFKVTKEQYLEVSVDLFSD